MKDRTEEMQQETEQKQARRGRGPAKRRGERVPFGVQSAKLSIDKSQLDPNYSYRWINDEDGRTERALKGGYEFVENKGQKVGEGTDDRNSNIGSRISQPVGTFANGKPKTAYLMRIKKDWYDEDQAAKQAKIDEVDASIQRGDLTGNNEGHGYIPPGGISVKN